MDLNRKDFAAGALFAGIGLGHAGVAWSSLPIGSALAMGPGYFPIAISLTLVLLGIAIIARAFFPGMRTRFGSVPWRGVIVLPLSAIVFAAFFNRLGMLPGVFVTTLIAALASPRITFLKAVLVSFGISVFCTFVFSYGLGIRVPVFGPWLGG